jgi:hypothetical protein
MDYEALRRLLEGVNQKNEPNMSMGTLASTPAVQEDDSQQIQQELPIQEEQLSLAETSQESTPSSQDINELRRGQQQFETYQLQKEAEDIDPKSEYLKLIQDYRKKINTPKKDTSTLEGFSAIANVLNQAAGIEAANRGANFRGMDTQAMLGQLKQQEAAERQQDLSGLDNLQKMYQQYLAMQAKSSPKALTDLDKAKIESEKARAAKFLADAKKAERAESKESKSVYEKEEEKRNVEKYFTAKKAAENSSANDMKVDDTLDTFLNYSKGSFTGTGPIATLGGLTSYFSKDTENLDAKFKDLGLDKMVKTFAGMSKAVDSDAERRAFEKTVPSITNDDETNLQILLGAKSINLRNKIEAEAQRKYVEENGKLDSGYKSPLETTPLTTVVNPKTGEMTLVPRKDKQKYNKMGLLDLDKYSKALLDGKAQKPVSSTEIQSDKKTDPKIEDYAKKYNLDYDKAQQILRARGYNG